MKKGWKITVLHSSSAYIWFPVLFFYRGVCHESNPLCHIQTPNDHNNDCFLQFLETCSNNHESMFCGSFLVPKYGVAVLSLSDVYKWESWATIEKKPSGTPQYSSGITCYRWAADLGLMILLLMLPCTCLNANQYFFEWSGNSWKTHSMFLIWIAPL